MTERDAIRIAREYAAERTAPLVAALEAILEHGCDFGAVADAQAALAAEKEAAQ